MKTKPTPPPAVRKWLAEIGKQGGKSKSPAKLAAIAQNAKKGGWPKGRPRKVPRRPCVTRTDAAGQLPDRM